LTWVSAGAILPATSGGATANPRPARRGTSHDADTTDPRAVRVYGQFERGIYDALKA
jgi:hypothetical protein